MIQYIPAQSSISQNTNTVLTIKTLHTNPITDATPSRTLSRPHLLLIEKTHFRITLLVPISIPKLLQALLSIILIFNLLPLNSTLTSLLLQNRHVHIFNTSLLNLKSKLSTYVHFPLIFTPLMLYLHLLYL